MSKKLEKVLEYLVNNQPDKAKELLHQVFIEKARSIHEELMNQDEEMEFEGDMGEDFRHDVSSSSEELDELSDEIANEETMEAEEMDDLDMPAATDDLGGELGDDLGDDLGSDDSDMDMDTDMDTDMDMDMDGEEAPMDAAPESLESIEDFMEKLKADLEKLEAKVDAAKDASEDKEDVEDVSADAEEDMEDAEEDSADAEEDMEDAEEDMEDAEEESDEDEEDSEEEMDESWLAEFDDLEEGIELDKVPVDNGPEVGAGKFSSDVGKNAKSPIAKAPEAMFGAKPVKTGMGATKSGFERETAPSAASMKDVKDNRRKKSTDGMKSVSKEGDGSATLNKKIGEEGKKSPLSSSPRK